MLNVWFWSSLGATGLVLLFALGSAALRHFSRLRLEESLQRVGRADRLHCLFRHHDDLVRTAHAGYVASLVALTVVAQRWAVGQFVSAATGRLVGVGVAVGLGLTLGGVVPMAWARWSADSLLSALLPVLNVVRVVLWPLTWVLGLVEGLVRRLLGVSGHAEPETFMEEEIRSVVSEGEREGAIEEDQKDMIESVIDFKKADVTDIMTPRTDIVSLEDDATYEEARHLIAESGHSRIPVTHGNIDTVVGILYAKDLLLRLGGEGDGGLARDVMRQPLFVPETKRLDELLSELQGAKVHLAVVLDEYGGTAGLVTIEDIVEEIFGEIMDEYEEEPPQPIRRVEPRAFVVEARVHIDELNDELSLDLPENEDYETIGGFVLSRLGYIPKKGESLEAGGLRITVLEAEERRINRLRVDLEPESADADNT